MSLAATTATLCSAVLYWGELTTTRQARPQLAVAVAVGVPWAGTAGPGRGGSPGAGGARPSGAGASWGAGAGCAPAAWLTSSPTPSSTITTHKKPRYDK